MPAPGPFGVPNPAFGQRQRGTPRKFPALAAAFQHPSRIGPDAFLDMVECRRLRAATVFDRGADHAARIADEVRDDDNAPPMQFRLGLRGAGDIGPLSDDFGVQAGNVVGTHHVRARRVWSSSRRIAALKASRMAT